MRSKLSLLSALAACLYPATSSSALPPGAQVVQAESMTLAGEGWTVREHAPEAWYAGRPFDRMLGGQNGKGGVATARLSVAAAGRYRVWVRYLDMVKYRSKSGFVLTGTQNGKPVVRKEFDNSETSPRSTAEGARKWGEGFSRWVWDFAEFDAAAGELRLAIEKVHLKPVHGCTRTLDVVVLTGDLAYEPAVTDLAPFYVKVRMLPGQKEPVVVHLFGRRPFSPWYTPHANINRKGIFLGAVRGSEDKPGVRMAAGDESPWVDIAPYLAYGGLNRVSLYAMRSYFQPEAEACFEMSFSRTPSAAGLIKKAERKGPGDGFVFAVDLVDYRLVTETEGSAASLEMARAAPPAPGKLPSEFPLFTGMALSPRRSTAEAVAREREALRRIGISGEKIRSSNFFFHLTESPGCLGRPERKRIEESMRQFAEKNRDRAGWTMINLMDEPGFSFDHVEGCAACREGFARYLKRLGLAEAEAARLKLNNDPDAPGRDDKASYYYTRRYLNHLMTEMHRAGTQSAQKHLPGIPTTSNFACELISGNMVSRCVDWYEIYGTGALTFGWNEDWGGWARSRQVNGYYVDVMRSACREPGLDFGIYNVLARAAWEIQARAFLEIGHGVKAISFFNYGPYYAITSDANSHRPEIYEAIKRVAFPIGAVEGHLMAGKTARGDAAQLLSVTGDVWQATRDNVFGKERAWLNLLLRHCNVRCDILSEDDLEGRLGAYKMLLANDANLRRSALAPVLRWVRDGGVLYLGAGALARDEFDEPLGLDEALGLSRGPLDLRERPGRSEYEMPRLKPLGVFEGMNLLCGTQKPYWQTVPVGRGKVVVVGFFPAISYIASSQRAAGADHSTLDFQAAHREWMQRVLSAADIRPRLRSDNVRVEANWIQAPAADVVAISNWTGQEQTVTVELDDAPAYEGVSSIAGRLLSRQTDGGSLRLRVAVGAGDLIELCRPPRPAAAGQPAMVRLAGTPAEIGRTFGAINKASIAHDLDVDYLAKAAAEKISEEALVERSRAFVRIAEAIAPHWLEEARAVAEAAGVCPESYVGFVANRERSLFLHECTSYAAARDLTRGGAILFHKNRDNTDRAQAAFIVESSLPGINKFIAVNDASRIACSMMVNEKGLAGSADYPVHFTRKKEPDALHPPAAEPEYRGMMSGAMLRYIAEKASNCGEALGIIEDFVKKGYYAGGKVNGQHWLFVDRSGAILEVSNNSRHVVSRLHGRTVYFSRSDQSAAAKTLRGADRPIDFHLFHNVSRDPSICLKSSISGMTVEIDPRRPDLLTCAWVSLPACGVSFPLLMGQAKTPACLVNGDAYSLGRQAGAQRALWEATEKALHADGERLKEEALALASTGGAKKAAALLDAWAQQQAAKLRALVGR